MKNEESTNILKNAFDLIEDLNIEEVNKPTVIDVGHNFFDIPLGAEENTPVEIPASTPANDTNTADTNETTTDTENDSEDLKIVELKGKDDEDYQDYNAFSVIALDRIKTGSWDLDESEIPKDLDPETLLDLIDAQEKANKEKFQEQLYTQAGEFANYVKFYLQGGSKEVINDALDVKRITLLDPSTEDNQREILTAYLEFKGVEEDVIEDTIETLLDKGKGKQKSEEALQALAKYEQDLLANQMKELEAQKAKEKENYENHVKTVTSVVKKGKIGGVSIDPKKQNQIIDALFKPTELVERIAPNGEKVKTRATKAAVLFEQVQKDPEKLASMMLWLLEGGTFESIADDVIEQKNSTLRDILKAKKTATVVNKQKQNPNGFEIIANNINNFI